MSSKVLEYWIIQYDNKNTQKWSRIMFISDQQINSNRLGCVKNIYRNVINSVDDHRVSLCIRSSIGCVFGLPADWFFVHWIWSFVSSFSLVVGCGSTFARALPNMPRSFLIATGQPLHVFVCWGWTSHLNNWVHITTVPACNSIGLL